MVPAAQVTVHAKESTGVTACFSDPNDKLSYSATLSDLGVSTVSASGPNITITAVLPGSALVTVTATDPGGLHCQQRFPVTVPNRAPAAEGTIADAEVQVDGDTEATMALIRDARSGQIAGHPGRLRRAAERAAGPLWCAGAAGCRTAKRAV